MKTAHFLALAVRGFGITFRGCSGRSTRSCRQEDAANREATALSLSFTPRQREVYWLFWSAYNLRIDAGRFRELFGRELDEVFGHELRIGRRLGYLRKDGKSYELTRRGAYLFHLLEQRYTLQYIDKTWRTAGRTPWPDEVVLY